MQAIQKELGERERILKNESKTPKNHQSEKDADRDQQEGQKGISQI